MDQVYGSSRKASFKERKYSSGEKSAVFPLSARIPREFMEIELCIGVSVTLWELEFEGINKIEFTVKNFLVIKTLVQTR